MKTLVEKETKYWKYTSFEENAFEIYSTFLQKYTLFIHILQNVVALIDSLGIG